MVLPQFVSIELGFVREISFELTAWHGADRCVSKGIDASKLSLLPGADVEVSGGGFVTGVQ